MGSESLRRRSESTFELKTRTPEECANDDEIAVLKLFMDCMFVWLYSQGFSHGEDVEYQS